MNNRRIIITESEKQDIKKMYSLVEKKDFIFDFVLTENHKYLIIMDEVFVAGGNGNSIGSIWDNTHVFNEILKESISKMNIINEEIQNNIFEFIEDIKWEKELVKEWVKDKSTITEGWWDDFKSGASDLAKKVGSGIMDTVGTIFKQGVLPFLRWVRRGLYTGVGIVIDVVVSILAAKTNAIVWFVIVLLDIYEIGTGDFDPQDPSRMQLPFFFLMADLLGCVFTGAVAFTAKKAAPIIAKKGLSKGAPTMVKMCETLAQKIPALKNTLRSVANSLTKKFGSGGVIAKILGFIDRILTKFSEFLSKLLSKQGLRAAGAGIGVIAVGKGIEYAMPKIDPKNKVGSAILGFEKYAQDKTGYGKMVVSQEEGDAILSMANLDDTE
jgi:hypothetical protein